jgi:hypothetical protein
MAADLGIIYFTSMDKLPIIALWLIIVFAFGIVVRNWAINFLAMCVSIILLLDCMKAVNGISGDAMIIALVIIVQFLFMFYGEKTEA